MKVLNFNFVKFFFFSICVLVLSHSAFAISLDEAKEKGFLGEQQNGYLGAVSDLTPELQVLLNEVNAQRKAKYFEIAKKNNTTLAAVEALAGKKAISESSGGRFVQDDSGKWVKK